MQQVQQAISRRELEMTNGSQEHHTERQRFKEIDSIMAPRREKHASLGISVAQAINHLFSLNNEFETNPVGLLSRTLQHVPMTHEQTSQQMILLL
jgi:hypothetical protein